MAPKPPRLPFLPRYDWLVVFCWVLLAADIVCACLPDNDARIANIATAVFLALILLESGR